MPNRPPSHRPPTGPHHDDRPNSGRRGYDRRWRKLRAAHLAMHPSCVLCLAEQRATPATEVDHIVAHRGDAALFWDASNLRALCKPCHSAKTVREDGGLGRKAASGD